jgi:hypothetical protein
VPRLCGSANTCRPPNASALVYTHHHSATVFFFQTDVARVEATTALVPNSSGKPRALRASLQIQSALFPLGNQDCHAVYIRHPLFPPVNPLSRTGDTVVFGEMDQQKSLKSSLFFHNTTVPNASFLHLFQTLFCIHETISTSFHFFSSSS